MTAISSACGSCAVVESWRGGQIRWANRLFLAPSLTKRAAQSETKTTVSASAILALGPPEISASTHCRPNHNHLMNDISLTTMLLLPDPDPA